MKAFRPIGMLLFLTAVAGYLLTSLDTTVHQPIFDVREAWLLLMGCLYGYGAGIFLYARKDQLFKGNALLDKGEKEKYR